MLAFSSRSIYWKGKSGNEKIWISDNESKIIENEILIDNENIFITGRFTFPKEINFSDVRTEEYHYTAIFKRSKDLVQELLLLQKKEIMSNDFKYVQIIPE